MQFETRPVGDGVYEIRDVETGEQFLMNVNTMQTSVQLDELTRTALMAVLEEFGIVMQDNGTYIATERGSQSGTPERVEREQLSGKDAWDANFGRSGPPDWVTSVGGSWGSSPSGWNSGGWDPTGGDPYGWGKTDPTGNPLTNAAWSLQQSSGYAPLSEVQRQVDGIRNSRDAFRSAFAGAQPPGNTGSAPQQTSGRAPTQALGSAKDMMKRLKEGRS